MNTKQYKLRKFSKKKDTLPQYTFGTWLEGLGQKKTGDESKLGSWLRGSDPNGSSASKSINKVFNIGSYGLDLVMPGTGQLMRTMQQTNLNGDTTNSQGINSAAAVQNQGGGSINNYASMWSMGGVVPGNDVPNNKKANSAVRNNMMRAYTDKEIGGELLKRGLFGEVTDTTAKLNEWYAKPYQQKQAFIDSLSPDSGVSYTSGKGTKTGNPGGVAYWTKDLANISNSQVLKSMRKNSSYPQQYGAGGVVPGGQPNSELEKNEVTLGPDGTMKKFNLPPHPNSSRVPLEQGTVIFSDNPKMRMPDGQLPAEAADKLKRQKNAIQKVFDNPNATKIARDTAKRSMSNIDSKLGSILQFQMSKSQELGGNSTNVDGTVASGYGDIIQTVAQLAPTIYNTIKGQQPVEKLNPAAFQNPLAYGALQSMRGRQVNVNPMLTNNAESAAVAESNLRNSGTGGGAYRAGVMGIQNARMKANSAVLGQASMQNNAYLGEYGQMQGNLGQAMSQTNLMISDLNARNEAAGRNYNAAAAGQISQFAQTQQLMQGQKQRDQQLLPMFQSWLDQMSGKSPLPQSVEGSTDTNVGFNMSASQSRYKMLHP